MLETECLGLSVHKYLVVVVFLTCLIATLTQGQTITISDADVNLSDVSAISDGPRGSVAGVAASKRSRSGGKELVNLASQQRKPGQSELREAIYIEAARYRIDPDLVFALVWQESRWNLRAVSPKNARGPLQLMPGTAARFGVRDPHDPKEAARGGVAYLVWLLDRFDGNVSLALSAYNAGQTAVDAYLSGKPIMLPGGKVINPRGIKTNGIPPYQETESYVRRVAQWYRLIRAERQASTFVR